MSSFAGVVFSRLRNGFSGYLKNSKCVKKSIPAQVRKRMQREFQYAQIALAMPIVFRPSSLYRELYDRQAWLFEAMNMPILMIESEGLDEHEAVVNGWPPVPNIERKTLPTGCYPHVEMPNQTNLLIQDFLEKSVVLV